MNEFGLMLEDGCLLTAGNLDNFNTMTINWGTIGNLWNKKVVSLFVRPSSYTKTFLDQNEYFTLSFFYPRYREILSYLGSVSGKDENKVKNSGLTPMVIDNCVTFKEAYLTVVCKKLSVSSFNETTVPKEVNKIFYANGNYHTQFIGEIVKHLYHKD